MFGERKSQRVISFSRITNFHHHGSQNCYHRHADLRRRHNKLDVDSIETDCNVTEKIEANGSTPAADLSKSGRTIAECNVQEERTLQLVLRGGGMGCRPSKLKLNQNTIVVRKVIPSGSKQVVTQMIAGSSRGIETIMT